MTISLLFLAVGVSHAQKEPLRLVTRNGATYLSRGDTLEYRVFQGDILIPVGDDSGGVAAAIDADLWEDGIVRYEFDDNVPDARRQIMRNAFAIMEGIANVRFSEGVGALEDGIDIESTASDDCPDCVCINSATIGDTFYGSVLICNWICDDDGDGNDGDECMQIILHELGHVLNLYHEQARPDRDNFVQINLGNIRDDEKHNFEKQDDARTYGDYDFDSLMHYSQCAFSTCWGNCGADPGNCRTITMRAGYETFQNTIGMGSDLSRIDRLTLSFLYPQEDWRFTEQHACNLCTEFTPCLGTFLFPYCNFWDGYDGTPEYGTLWIQPGAYSSTGTYGKPITIQAPLGAVTLGG